MNATPPVPDLENYLEACTERYTACLDSLSRTVAFKGFDSTARFHYLKLDANGRPRWRDLAKNLADHILSYCFAVQKRPGNRSDQDTLALRREAKDFFREENRSGEAGEILLYFLQEAVLRAPQIVSKISLKTNPRLETFGSDGIHVKWHEADGKLDLYFGEAKLYKNLGDAATGAVDSILRFHESGMENFEVRMVTRHFKHADGLTKDAILEYVKGGTSTKTVRINHACLLGYNSRSYTYLPHGGVCDLEQIFRDRYETHVNSLRTILETRFSKLKKMRLRFEIFVLPFTSVDKFRKAFLEAL